MQRRAVDILAAIGDVGTDGEILNELEQIITDPKAPMSIRCSVAIALGQMTVPNSIKANVSEKVLALANLASFACRSELKRIEFEEIRALKETGSIASGGNRTNTKPSVVPVALEMYQVVLLRRRLKYQLNCVQDGLNGPDPSSPAGLSSLPMSDKENTFLKEVFEHSKSITDLVDDMELGFSELKTELLAEVSRLDMTIKKAPIPKKSSPAPELPGTVPGGKSPRTPAAAKDGEKPAAGKTPAKPAGALPASGLPKALPK